jgi:hypothetical protein
MDAKVHVGHYFWIAGILLMLSPVIGDIPRLPAAKWLGVVGLIVITWLGIPRAISLIMHPATARDDFFYVVAWNFREPAICQKIDPSAIGRDDQREDHELTYMRSDCYRNIAAMLNAPPSARMSGQLAWIVCGEARSLSGTAEGSTTRGGPPGPRMAKTL